MSFINSILNSISNKQSFFRNISILVISNVLVNIVNLFTNMYLARVLKPEIYGEYGVLITWSNILLVISSLGIQQVVIRNVALNQSNSKYLFYVSIVARLFGFILFIPLFVLYNCYSRDFTYLFVLIIILNVFTLSIWDGIQNIAFGMQRMEYTGYINFIGALMLLLFYILIPSADINLLLVMILLISVQCLKDLLYYYKCRREKLFTNDTRLYGKVAVARLTVECLPFYILSLFTLVTMQFPVLFLAANSNTTEVAFFNTANKLLVPMSLTINTIMVALFPNLAKDASLNFDKLVLKIKKILVIIIPTGVFVCISVALFRNELVSVVYGYQYKNTGDVMLAQCWFLLFNALFSLMATIWASLKKDKLLAFSSIIYALINAIILWVSSFYGATVLSYGYVLGAIINMTYFYYLFNKTIKFSLSLKFSVIIFCIIGAGFCFSLFVPIFMGIIARLIIWLIFCLTYFIFVRKKILL